MIIIVAMIIAERYGLRNPYFLHRFLVSLLQFMLKPPPHTMTPNNCILPKYYNPVDSSLRRRLSVHHRIDASMEYTPRSHTIAWDGDFRQV